MAPGHPVKLALPGGDELDIFVPDDFDFLAHHVALTGGYFPPHYELALEVAPPDGVILDLGAHLGTFTLAAAASGRRVIAVEASPRNFDLLTRSVRANRVENLVTIVQVAVGDRAGTARFQQEGAWGQVTDSLWARDVVEVQVRPVPELLADLRVGHVDVVKLDVEGSEIAVLDGMAHLLSSAEAPAVVYESNAHTLRMFDATPEALLARFSRLGFDNYLVDDQELLLTPVTSTTFQPETNVDYFAVKGRLELSSRWTVHTPRTDGDLAAAVSAEARRDSVPLRGQVARSLERAPVSLLRRRDVQLTLHALALDPDEDVARAAAWWVRADRDRRLTTPASASVRQSFHLLSEQGRALRDRIEQIRIRWGARP